MLKKGTQTRDYKRGTRKGYSTERRNCFGFVRPYFAGYWRAVHGSPGQPSVEFVRHGTVEYSRGTHRVLQRTHAGIGSDSPVCTAAWAWADATQCSACVSHHGVHSKVGERHRTEGDLACGARRVRTRAIRVCACAAPTRVPTGTPAPTNVGDTNPPTRAPNFADPTGEGDAIGTTCLPSLPASPPCSSRHPLAARCIALALGPPPTPRTGDGTGRAGKHYGTTYGSPLSLWCCEVLRQCFYCLVPLHTLRRGLVRGRCGMAEGRACGAVVRRRVRVR
jgi:hypothetical protein